MTKVKKSTRDTIGRRGTIVNLSKLLIYHKDPFVLNINGKWGSGKTTFVKLWQEYLEEKYQLKSIYFSAWEDDFSDDPFISILGEIHTYLKDMHPNNKINYKFKKTKDIATKIIRKGFPAFIKGSTAGFLDIDKGFEAALGSITESAALELIEKHSENKNQISQFKQLLSEIIKELNQEMPLVIFIDELDRCRPSYAIELLERIKHIFGIEQVVFVLSTDKVQLSQSIKVLYGDIDTENYLRRFIDLEFNLPEVTDAFKYLTMLESKYSVTSGLQNSNLEYSRMIRARERIMEPLYYNLNLSLRQAEEVYRYQQIIYLASYDNFHLSYIVLLPILLSLKVYNDAVYKELIHYKANKDEILKIMLSDKSKFYNVIDQYTIEATILFILKNEEDKRELISTLEKNLKQVKNKEEVSKITFLINWGKEEIRDSTIEKTIRKIEFIEEFTFFDDKYNEENFNNK